MIYLVISLVLDLFLNQFFPYVPLQLTYFQPLLFLTACISYIYFFNKKKNSLRNILIITLIYDLFFGNIYLLNTVLIFVLFYEVKYLLSRVSINFFLYIFIIISGISLYFIQKYTLLLLIGIENPFSFLLYQLTHSIILNLCYSLILYYFFGIKLKKR